MESWFFRAYKNRLWKLKQGSPKSHNLPGYSSVLHRRPCMFTSGKVCILILKQGGVHKLRLQNLASFDHLPPSIYIFYGMKVYKKLIFLTTYPPPLVNVVCEWPLT